MDYTQIPDQKRRLLQMLADRMEQRLLSTEPLTAAEMTAMHKALTDPAFALAELKAGNFDAFAKDVREEWPDEMVQQ
jgi:phage/plasmid primase-like uncharacterized protein